LYDEKKGKMMETNENIMTYKEIRIAIFELNI
jgi:hypothetical protein